MAPEIDRQPLCGVLLHCDRHTGGAGASVSSEFAQTLVLADVNELLTAGRLRRARTASGADVDADSLQSYLLAQQRELAELRATVRRLVALSQGDVP